MRGARFSEYRDAIEWLTERRKEQGLSLVEVARRMQNGHHSSVWRIELGSRTPSFSMLQKYAAAMGYEVHALVMEKKSDDV